MSAIQRIRRLGLVVVCAAAAAFLPAAPASARAADTYAAIAFSPKTGAVGSGSNVDSQEKAEKAALADCKADDAQVVVGVKNGYCALAVGANHKYGVGAQKAEDTGDTALKTAKAECRKITHYDDKEYQGFCMVIPSGPFSLGISSSETSVQDEIIRLTNVERKKAGVPELAPNDSLSEAERLYAWLMVRKNKLAHDLDGESGDRLNKAGYKWMTWGENIAADQTDAAAVVKAWMDDPLHRANLLNKDFTEIGVGVAYTAVSIR
jgi:uncharacterized protein YkwD